MSGTSSPAQREKLALEYLAERAARNPARTPSRTYTNSTTEGLYTGNRMQSGRGEAADQHFQYTGAGFRAQIERRQA